MPTHPNLSKFMTNLAQNPALMLSFNSNASALMAQANLSAEEQAFVLERNPTKLWQTLKPGNGSKLRPAYCFRVSRV